MMEEVTDKSGRTYKRRRRPLGPRSINMLLTLLGQILQQARLRADPEQSGSGEGPVPEAAAGEEELPRDRRVPFAAGRRRELESEARRNIKGLGRRAMVASLGLSGCGSRSSSIFRSRPWTCIAPGSSCRTRRRRLGSGGRDHDVPARRAAHLRRRPPVARAAARSGRLLLGTTTGKRRDPDWFRDRILARALERASANRSRRG